MKNLFPKVQDTFVNLACWIHLNSIMYFCAEIPELMLNELTLPPEATQPR